MIDFQTATRPTAIRDLFNGLQDHSFGAATELVYGRDRLTLAARWDDQESAIERVVFGEMRACGCRCCGRHLPRLIRADAYDHQERYEGHALALVRVEAAAAEVRAFSSQVERGRLVVIGAGPKQLRRMGLDSGGKPGPEAA